MDSPEQQTSKRNPFSLKHFVLSSHSHSSSASSFMAINRPVGISWSNQPHNWCIVKMSSFSNKQHESKARRRKSWQASTWIYGQVSGAGRVGRGGGVEGGINHITPFARFQLPSNTPVSVYWSCLTSGVILVPSTSSAACVSICILRQFWDNTRYFLCRTHSQRIITVSYRPFGANAWYWKENNRRFLGPKKWTITQDVGVWLLLLFS